MAVCITICLGIITLLYLIYKLSCRNLNHWKELGIPHMENALPVFGNIMPILRKTVSVKEFKIDVYNTFKGEKFCGYLMNQTPVFMPRDPQLVNDMFIKDFSHFQDRLFPKTISDIISNSLFNRTGEEWRDLRYKLTPIFTSVKLKFMFSTIKECSDDVVTYLKEKKFAEVHDTFFKFAINVTGDVAFGIKVNALKEEDGLGKTFIEATNSFFSLKPKQFFNITLHFTCPTLANFLKLPLVDPKVNDFINNLTKDIIKQRQLTNTKRNDFLELLLENRKKERALLNVSSTSVQEHNIDVDEPEDTELLKQMENIRPTETSNKKDTFSDICIASQLFSFISIGSESTASILTFTLYELSMNPDIQNRLQADIQEKVKTFGFNFDSIKKMDYLEKVLYETLRLHNSSGGIFRVCTKDYVVPSTEILLKKGTMVVLPIMGLHLDPEYFPEPMKFNPDRFTDVKSLPKNVFYPFGAGPRMCIAMRFAMLEMKILIATLLLNFNIRVHEKTQLPITMIKSSVIMKVNGGMWLQFEERE